MTRGKALEDAVTAVLPGDEEAYFFDPYLLFHANGKCYGVFGGANQALAWQRGTSARDREFFYIEDMKGNRVTIEDQPRRPGHAYAIIDKLRQARS